MKKARTWFVLILAVLAAAAGGYYYYSAVYLPSQAPAEPALQKARVRTGDLVVVVSGVGELTPEAQASAAFRTSGVVAAVYAAAGDPVTSGQLLASLDDTNAQLQLAQSQAALQDLVSPAALLQAQIGALSAEVAYEKALGDLKTLISPAVWQAEQDLALAQAALAEVPASDSAALAAAQSAVELAEANLAQAQADYAETYLPALFTRPYTDPTSGETERGVFPPSAAEIGLSRAKLAAAQLALNEARAFADLLALGAPCDEHGELIIEASLTDRLEQACQSIRSAALALENTRLTAPLDGVLTSFNLAAGQPAGSGAAAVVTTLDQLALRVFVDETDLPALQVGQRVRVIFNAYPDQVVEGQVRTIDLALSNTGGTLAGAAWVDLADAPEIVLRSGMTADVEIIAGEALGALLVPVQALRELAPGSFAVFVVQADGELKLTPVSVGLRDFANAQILSGLQAGDTVSTGSVEIK